MECGFGGRVPVSEQSQDGDEGDEIVGSLQDGLCWRPFLERYGTDPSLEGDEVDHAEDPQVVKKSRDDGQGNDLEIGNTRDFRHDEGPRSHDGRHDLSACAGDRLNGRGFFGGKSASFHEGNRETARGIDVGDR